MDQSWYSDPTVYAFKDSGLACGAFSPIEHATLPVILEFGPSLQGQSWDLISSDGSRNA